MRPSGSRAVFQVAVVSTAGIALLFSQISFAETRVAEQTTNTASVNQQAFGLNNYPTQSFVATASGTILSVATAGTSCGISVNNGAFSYSAFNTFTQIPGGYRFTGGSFPVTVNGTYFITSHCNNNVGNFGGTTADSYPIGYAGHSRLPGQPNIQFASNASSDNTLLDWAFTVCTTNDCTLTPPPPPIAVCVQDCFSNVLFLPGIESSRLYRPQVVGSEEDRLWEPLNNGDVQDLFMNPDGSSIHSEIYTKTDDVLDELPTGKNIYLSFITKMNDLEGRNLINDWQPIAYDWRLSLDDILAYGNEVSGKLYYSGNVRATSTPYVIQELRRLAGSSKSGKVTIIAHSNGGLVAKQLTEVLGAEASDLIDKMIFVAVPQAGTPMAVAAGLHGYDQGLPADAISFILSEETVRTFASTSPMFYQLLPSARYFTYVDDPVITFDASLPEWIALYGNEIHSGPTLHQFLTDTFGRVDSLTGDKDQPIQMSDLLLSAAEALHTNLDNWTPPSGIELIQIAGWGVPTTVSGLTYKPKGAGVIPEPNFTIDGDGTVVVPSALWTSTAVAANYWINLSEYNRIFNKLANGRLRDVSHADILEVDELRTFVSDLITATVKPVGDYNYLSLSSPQATEDRLRYSLHSPLTLNLFDSQGRHTGVSTTTGEIEEQIPGTYYAEFGDVKYLFTDASTPARVFLDGYDTGTFTFEIEELLGDTLVASTTFKDIPTTPQTEVTIDVQSDITTLSPMQVDEDGDGTFDFTLVPKLNDVVTVDTTTPVTTALPTGTLGVNGWHTSDVIVSLTATDSESGVHATYFSLDGTATTTGTSVNINSEGTHTLAFYSDDNAGNEETPTTLTVKIDKTAPEAIIFADLVARDLSVVGIDALSSTTVAKTGSVTKITDKAGHTATLTFQKTYVGRLLTYAKLASITYAAIPPAALPSSFTYLWDSKQSLVSQTVVADKLFSVQALYDKKKDKTTIVVLKKNTPIQKQVLAGLVLIKLTTNKGVVGYEW